METDILITFKKRSVVTPNTENIDSEPQMLFIRKKTALQITRHEYIVVFKSIILKVYLN